jgi:undecaprenyl diphosphate synthase
VERDFSGADGAPNNPPVPLVASDVADGPIPAHVACIMDGNGRWASRRGLPRTEGHAAGEEALLDAVEGALDLGIPWITMYAFSTENWRRPADEVRYLMGFNESLLARRRDELNDKGVRIRFAGRRDWRVPKRVLRRMDESVELTAGNRRSTLTMAFNYGGRAEIVDAVTKLVADGVPADKVNEKAIRSRLYYPDQPDPDLMIRTSGEHRISNFLLWQLAYSELVFTNVLWPDFRRHHLFEAIQEFQRRQRTYGGVKGR